MAQLRKDLLTTPNRKRTNEKSLAELNRQKRDAEEGVVAAVREYFFLCVLRFLFLALRNTNAVLRRISSWSFLKN